MMDNRRVVVRQIGTTTVQGPDGDMPEPFAPAAHGALLARLRAGAVMPDDLDAAADAIAALPAAMVAVAVKPLVWMADPTWPDSYDADSPVGRYTVGRYDKGVFSCHVEPQMRDIGLRFRSPKEAMQAGDADYEARIRAALVAAPAPEPTRMCVACGRSVPASHGRTDPAPGCPSPEACTLDMTDAEAAQHWRQKYHDLRQERAPAPDVAGLVKAARNLCEQFAIENPMRTGDWHGDMCQCRRCRMDQLQAALAKLDARNG